MDVTETAFGVSERRGGRDYMTVYLRLLALLARSSPTSSYLAVHTWPYETCFDETARCFAATVCLAVQGDEDSSSMVLRDEQSRTAVGGVEID